MEKKNNPLLLNETDRRKFISNVTKAIGATVLLNSPLIGFAKSHPAGFKEITVGEIMDAFIGEVTGAPFSQTVDTLKAGNRDIQVTGIVTTMFATLGVIQKTIASGANFIIAHEPTFYNHTDDTSWLKNDPVYRFKSELLSKHQVAVWRNHDYIHSHIPDGVISGVVAKLGWADYHNASNGIASIPGIPLKELIQQVKGKLAINMVRYIGNPGQTCKKVLLMPGAAGGRRQIEAMSREQPDVLICGEIQEWETAEYVRDAQTKGQQLSLIVLGHIASEEPGSEYMADWLRKKIPGIKVTHVPPTNSLSFL
ncbi:MAG: Nif3-like dinuclear metal center hexameric protein [Chitinophagaceae bacterium]